MRWNRSKWLHALCNILYIEFYKLMLFKGLLSGLQIQLGPIHVAHSKPKLSTAIITIKWRWNLSWCFEPQSTFPSSISSYKTQLWLLSYNCPPIVEEITRRSALLSVHSSIPVPSFVLSHLIIILYGFQYARHWFVRFAKLSVLALYFAVSQVSCLESSERYVEYLRQKAAFQGKI